MGQINRNELKRKMLTDYDTALRDDYYHPVPRTGTAIAPVEAVDRAYAFMRRVHRLSRHAECNINTMSPQEQERLLTEITLASEVAGEVMFNLLKPNNRIERKWKDAIDE